jgi:acetyl esterase/lipase
MHVFTPPGHGASHQRPAIVFFSGRESDSSDIATFYPHCHYLASRGMVAVAAEFWSTSDHGGTGMDAVKEAKSAILYLRQNADKLGIDPARVAAGGGLNGGRIAAATAMFKSHDETGDTLENSSRPDALVLFSPRLSPDPVPGNLADLPASGQETLPTLDIDAATPPMVIFHGVKDSDVPVSTLRKLQSRMTAEYKRCDLHLYEGQSGDFFKQISPDRGHASARDALFKTDEFLVSLGYLYEPHEAPVPISGWVTIFGNAVLVEDSAKTSSPVLADADNSIIAASFPRVELADGDFIRLEGTATFNVQITTDSFRVGLFHGVNPLAAGDGTGYAGLTVGAASLSDASITTCTGEGSRHPFEIKGSTTRGALPAAGMMVPASTPVDFTLLAARNGKNLDISVKFSDAGSYQPHQSLLNVEGPGYAFDRVAFMMSDTLDATQARFFNVRLTRGRVLPSINEISTSEPMITYVDAVEGAAGNTFKTGAKPADISWAGPNDLKMNNTRWSKRTGFKGFNNETAFLSMSKDKDGGLPQLTTRLTGLADGTYNIWAFYWDNSREGQRPWVLSAGLNQRNLATYTAPGSDKVPGTTSLGVVNAATLRFDSNVSVSAKEGMWEMFGINLGSAEVSGGGVDVYVNNSLKSPGEKRTFYDGIGYQRIDTTAYPLIFGVDFRSDDQIGPPRASRFSIVAGSSRQGENADSYRRKNGRYDVVISQPYGTNLEFRGAGSEGRIIPNTKDVIGGLASGFIGSRAGAIDIHIHGLDAGRYRFKSSHFDPNTDGTLGFAQGTTPTSPNLIECQIGGLIRGAVEPASMGTPGINSTSVDKDQIPVIEFDFTHDGTSPLKIRFRSTRSNETEAFLLINAFGIHSHPMELKKPGKSGQ